MAAPVAVWDERIARARRLSAGSEHGRPLLDFYAGLAAYQRMLAASARALPAGDTFAAAVDLEAASEAALGLLDWLRGQGPPELARRAAVSAEPAASWRDRIRRRLGGDDADGDEFAAFVVEAALQPFAEAAAAARNRPPRSGPAEHPERCPVCGSRPVVGALREEGEGARRTLVCGLCATEWDYLRVRCPACREERFDALPFYTADALPHARIDACDSCRTYLKTIDLTKDGLALPVVDDLASVPLDLWARERGYHRLRPGLLRV